MLPLLRSEIFRLSRRAMPRVLLLILALAVAGFYLLFWFLLRNPPAGMPLEQQVALRDDIQLRAVRGTGLDFVHNVGTVLVVILGVSAMSTEFGWGTIRTILPRAAGRSAFLTAKLIAILLFVALVVVLGFLVALAASALVTVSEDLGAELGAGFLPGSLAAMARTAFAMLPYVALGFFLAVWTRSTATGIGISLSVLFLEGLGSSLLAQVGGTLGRIPELLLAENVRAVMQVNATGTGGGLSENVTDLPDPWRAATVLAIYIAYFLALSYIVFRRRDITAA